MTTRQYARLVSDWLASIDLDEHVFRHSFVAPNQGYADLPPDGQPEGRAAAAWPPEDQKYR